MLPGPTFVRTFLRTYAEVLGLDPHVLVEEYRVAHESGDEPEHLQPLSSRGTARDARRSRPRPWLILGLGALVVVVALLVVGLVGPDGEVGRDRAAPPPPASAPTDTREAEPQPPRRVVLLITPETETYVCVDTGPGSEVRFEGIIDAPRRFRGRRLRVNLGNTSVELRKNGRPVSVEPSTESVGFAFTPRSQRSLPLGQRPCA